VSLDQLLALLPDNSGGDIGADDLRTIVTELWNRPRNVVQGRWQYNETPSATPTGNQFTLDTTDLEAVSWVRFRYEDIASTDFSGLLRRLDAGDYLYIQDQNEANAFLICVVDGPATDSGSYIEVPVTTTDSGALAMTNAAFVGIGLPQP